MAIPKRGLRPVYPDRPLPPHRQPPPARARLRVCPLPEHAARDRTRQSSSAEAKTSMAEKRDPEPPARRASVRAKSGRGGIARSCRSEPTREKAESREGLDLRGFCRSVRESLRDHWFRCLLSLSAVLRIWPERSSEYKNRRSSRHSCEENDVSFGAYLSVRKGEAYRPVFGSHGCLQQTNGVLWQQDRQSLASTSRRERKLTLLLCSSGSRLCRTSR